MSTVTRRFEFIIHDDVELDVEDVLKENPEEAAVLIAVIEEIEGDHALCERLVDVGFEDDQVQSVKVFAKLQEQRYNAYTVRLYEVDRWRLITAVDHRQRLIALLYIMRRDEDYDSVVQERVVKAYEDLGLGQLGRC